MKTSLFNKNLHTSNLLKLIFKSCYLTVKQDMISKIVLKIKPERTMKRQSNVKVKQLKRQT